MIFSLTFYLNTFTHISPPIRSINLRGYEPGEDYLLGRWDRHVQTECREKCRPDLPAVVKSRTRPTLLYPTEEKFENQDDLMDLEDGSLPNCYPKLSKAVELCNPLALL
ncbi:hypothetical protein K3495_g9325 [Podosphaera aphanis]|nr:hypothetical protein K3495_g9325 [Podosphaera aphanis]